MDLDYFFEDERENIVYAWCHICRGVIHDCTEVVSDVSGRRTNRDCSDCPKSECFFRFKKLTRIEALKCGIEIQELPCSKCLADHPRENLFCPAKIQVLTKKKKLESELDCPSYDSWLRNKKEDRLDCPGREDIRRKNV